MVLSPRSVNFYPRSPCGERLDNIEISQANCNFYPRSPCGERPWVRGSRVTYVEFLSTLSLRRATPSSSKTGRSFRYFYPRSPCGERRCDGRPQSGWTNISIHALLAESDWSPVGQTEPPVGISIHALLAESDGIGFLRVLLILISIHALLAESDITLTALLLPQIRFLSTLSLRRATGP